MISKQRAAAASLVASASVLVGVAVHEGYSSTAYRDTTGEAAAALCLEII